MKIKLVQRRTIWWPTAVGWVALVAFLSVPVFVWWFEGESFLASTRRESADILVVEGWIGIDGIQAAKEEFDRGGYRYVVTAGGVSYSKWDRRRWNYAEFAHDLLQQAGLPPDKIITAQATATEDHRTFKSAVTVWEMLRARGIQRKTLNVFTIGAHARRSRLVFAKVFEPETKVGMVAWTQSDYAAETWWHSSERADALIKETVGYLFEVLLNSGRRSNDPAKTTALQK